MHLYLAGPMRTYPRYNFDAFFAAAERLRKAGYTVTSPAEMDIAAGFNPDTDEATEQFVDEAMQRDYKAIEQAQGVALLEGWEQSTGTAKEIRHAIQHIKQIAPEAHWLSIVTEQRTTDPQTGAQKGTKLARFDLLPVKPLWAVAEHYGRGAAKYADRNWEKGYDWNLSYAALQRHANLFWGGEDTDSETGSHHLAAVVFHAFAMMEYGRTHPEKDNRPK